MDGVALLNGQCLPEVNVEGFAEDGLGAFVRFAPRVVLGLGSGDSEFGFRSLEEPLEVGEGVRPALRLQFDLRPFVPMDRLDGFDIPVLA